jgi:aminoglycoside phosphotransferase (APT) family kinase protein
MQARAETAAPVRGRPESPDWDALLSRAREIARESVLPEAQHWNDVVKRAQKALPKIATRWESRPINAWCHGDLHPGNAMRRTDDEHECVLIDLALVHAGHWVEDAVYLERQFWARPDALFGLHPVTELARYRRELGLSTEGDYGTLANLRRVLMAACAPVHVAGDGHPRYLHAALEMLERVLPQVGR